MANIFSSTSELGKLWNPSPSFEFKIIHVLDVLPTKNQISTNISSLTGGGENKWLESWYFSEEH